MNFTKDLLFNFQEHEMGHQTYGAKLISGADTPLENVAPFVDSVGLYKVLIHGSSLESQVLSCT